jgi:hypothetical protein
MVDGVAYRTIAAEFSVSLGSLSRHRAHIVEVLKARSAGEREEHSSDLLKRVGKLADAAEEILTAARTKDNFTAATSALNAACRLLELCGRLSGELQAPGAGVHLTLSKTTINNYGDPGSDEELARLLFEALDGFDPDRIAHFKAIAEGSNRTPTCTDVATPTFRRLDSAG